MSIDGYRWPYRINEDAEIEKFWNGKWVALKPYISGRRRAMVKMRTVDNKPVDVPLVWLMADAFMGGRKPGTCIAHRNGVPMECHLNNLKRVTRRELGAVAGRSRRKAVVKIDRAGNVVEVYRSVGEAARRNYLCRSAVSARCRREVASPFDLDGHNYLYEDAESARRN